MLLRASLPFLLLLMIFFLPFTLTISLQFMLSGLPFAVLGFMHYAYRVPVWLSLLAGLALDIVLSTPPGSFLAFMLLWATLIDYARGQSGSSFTRDSHWQGYLIALLMASAWLYLICSFHQEHWLSVIPALAFLLSGMMGFLLLEASHGRLLR